MSRLIDYIEAPPEQVEIGGAIYLLNGDYKTALQTMFMLWDDEVFDNEKPELLLYNMYAKLGDDGEPHIPDDILENAEEAAQKAVSYLQQNRVLTDKEKNEPPILDLDRDGQMIYDAFLLKGIDLDKEDMNHWTFLSHLRELPEKCALSVIVHLRSQYHKGKLTKDENALCAKIGWELIDLKQNKKDIEPW